MGVVDMNILQPRVVSSGRLSPVRDAEHASRVCSLSWCVCMCRQSVLLTSQWEQRLSNAKALYPTASQIMMWLLLAKEWSPEQG